MGIHNQRLVEGLLEAEAARDRVHGRQHITSRAVAVFSPGPEVLVLADDHARRRRVLQCRWTHRHLSDALRIQEDVALERLGSARVDEDFYPLAVAPAFLQRRSHPIGICCIPRDVLDQVGLCLLYTSDAADE